ncbi:MAG: PEP-CTERM sorting domain-containing protein [Planctomycetota bacterium]
MKYRTCCLLASAVLLQACTLLKTTAQAGDISWASPLNTGNVSDIFLTGGEIVSALNGGGGSVTVGGVTFSATDLLMGSPTALGMLDGASTGNASYDALLDSVDFGGGASASITLGAGGLLTPGESYTLQLWYTDLRENRTMRYGNAASTSQTVDLISNAGGFGQHVTGTFTATSTSQTLFLEPQGFANAHFNALLLQNTSAPPPQTLPAKTTPGWSINTQGEWSAAYNSGSYNTQGGEAIPIAEGAVFESKVQQFTQKQRFDSMTITQNAQWGAGQWSNAGNLAPISGGDAGVFLSPADGDYWFFNAMSNGGQYHAWQSTDMENWTAYGNVTGKDWVTNAEYADGKFYVYYDEPNDEDPHLIVFESAVDLINGVRTEYGEVFDDPSNGSDIAVFRDLDSSFHIIYEDWSAINARERSWDSQYAGHTSSPEGISGFTAHEHTAPIDFRGDPTGQFRTYEHPFNGTLTYQVHTDGGAEAWGDYDLIRVGDTYYLFADDHPLGEDIGLGYFYSDDLYGEFTYGGMIADGFHPDPTVGFAEGEFIAITQGPDFTSAGPWVDGVEVQAGVDTDGDGQIDVWTDWQEVHESYGRIDGFAKAFSVDPASLDLAELPEGYGFQFRIRSDDTAAVLDAIQITSIGIPLLGDLDGDGVLTDADINAFVLALTDPAAYTLAYEGLDPDVLGDFSGDNVFNNLDIAGFVEALNTSRIDSSSVPEPGSVLLVGLGALISLRRVRRD